MVHLITPSGSFGIFSGSSTHGEELIHGLFLRKFGHPECVLFGGTNREESWSFGRYRRSFEGIWVLLGPTTRSLWEYPTASNKDRPITLSCLVQLSCSINRPWGQNSESSSIFINFSSTFIDLHQSSSIFINLHRSSSTFMAKLPAVALQHHQQR